MESVTATLASAAISILAPYAKKTAEAFIDSAGEAAYQKAKGLFESLKARWVGKPAAANLEEFRQDPDGSKDILQAVLRKQLDNDPTLRDDVERRIQDIGPFIDVFQKMGHADGAVGVDADEIKHGRVGVHQEADAATNMIGVRAKIIGS